MPPVAKLVSLISHRYPPLDSRSYTLSWHRQIADIYPGLFGPGRSGTGSAGVPHTPWHHHALQSVCHQLLAHIHLITNTIFLPTECLPILTVGDVMTELTNFGRL